MSIYFDFSIFFYIIFFRKKMAKGRRFKVRYYKRNRWSANIRKLNATGDANSYSSFYTVINLCQNPQQADNTVSQQYTVKNTEFSFEIELGVNSNDIENLCGYILYIPQGYYINNDTVITNHPEWIMAMKYYGSASNDNFLTGNGSTSSVVGSNYSKVFRIKSRLARRLQTGDSIVFLVTGSNEGATGVEVKIRGIARWWTKAN